MASPANDRETLLRQLGIAAGAISRAEQRVADLVDGLATRALTGSRSSPSRSGARR